MAFDVDAFRKAAEAANLSKAEIENEIKFQTSASSKTDPFEKDAGGFKLGSLNQIQERLGSDWWHLPAGLAAIGAGIYGASRLMGGGNTPPPSDGTGIRIDPTMNVEPITSTANIPSTSLQQTNLTPEDLRSRASLLKTTPVVPEIPPQFTPGPVMPAGDIPSAPPYQPISTPLSAAPIDAPAPTPSAAPNSPVTSIVTDTIKELIQEAPAQPVTPQPVAPSQELLTGTGKPAFAGQGPAPEFRTKGKLSGEPKLRNFYADIAEVPTGYAFVPGAQNIDTPRTNLGQVEYTKAYTDRPFPLTNEMAVQESNEINRLLGRPTRAEAKAAGITLPPQTPGITKAVLESKASPSMGTKAAKVGGVLGALIAIPDLAKAETAGQRGMAGANLLEAVLPPGFTMSGAGEGSAAVPSVNAAMLLGSPYAQSEIAKKRRQQEEYTRKVGAGRGIAPPSAYLR